jgi:hypothetical protein
MLNVNAEIQKSDATSETDEHEIRRIIKKFIIQLYTEIKKNHIALISQGPELFAFLSGLLTITSYSSIKKKRKVCLCSEGEPSV